MKFKHYFFYIISSLINDLSGELDCSIRFKESAILLSNESYLPFVTKKIKRLMGEVPEWVKILPPREDVASYYRAADLFISPSRAEGMTYSVIECAYCKCPMIVSDICGQGHARAIPGAKIVENENTEMLREAIIESITVGNSSLEEAADYVKENYSLDIWCNKMLSLFNDLLENEKRNAE